MTPADPTLALVRPVGGPGFRWLPGMRIQWMDGSWWRLLSVAEDGRPLRAILDDGEYVLAAWGMAGQPGAAGEFVAVDLADPATVGTLLALVREAWAPVWVELMREGDPADGDGAWGYVSVESDGDAGARCFWSHTDDGWAEALVAALEAAP